MHTFTNPHFVLCVCVFFYFSKRLYQRCLSALQVGFNKACPLCNCKSEGVSLLSLDFSETKSACSIGSNTLSIRDGSAAAARESAYSSGGKRKVSIDETECINIAALYSDSENLFCSDRTGRWTSEEVAYVDALTDAFDCGMLLLMNGTRLHDFLTNFLRCKLSRLTKKFKKANFTRCYVYRRENQCDQNVRFKDTRKRVAETFSAFVSSQGNEFTKAQLRLLSSAQWKRYLVEFFSEQLGVSMDNFIGVEGYRSSIQELDRLREYHADELKKRRKLDITGQRTISIEDIPSLIPKKVDRPRKLITLDTVGVENKSAKNSAKPVAKRLENNKLGKMLDKRDFKDLEEEPKLSIISEPFDDDFLLLWGIREEVDPIVTDDEFQSHSDSDSSSQQVHPFLSKLDEYFAKNFLPFDYVEVWLPVQDQGKVSLCCGGGLFTVRSQASAELLNFANISSKTSFDAGVGLPGRTYSTGRSCWEQGIQYAQASHFPRVEAAGRAGIQTAVSIPIPCEAVGSLIVCFFSTTSITKDDSLVARLWEELNSLNSVSQWALDVNGGNNFDLLDSSPDIFKPNCIEEERSTAAKVQNSDLAIDKPVQSSDTSKQDLLKLLTEQIPLTSGTSSQEELNILSGFMLLRMLLLRNEHSLNARELENVQVMCASYKLYAKMNKWSHRELAQMLVREFLYLNPSGSVSSFFHGNGSDIALTSSMAASTRQSLQPFTTFLHCPQMTSNV